MAACGLQTWWAGIITTLSRCAPGRVLTESTSTAAREDTLFLFHVECSYTVFHLAKQTRYRSPPFRLASLCVHLGTAHIEDPTIAPETAVKGDYATHIPDVVVQWQAPLAALPSVKTLRLYGGSPTCFLVLGALSASAEPLQRVFAFHSAVHSAVVARQDGVGDTDAGTGTPVASRKFVQTDVGTELVGAVSGRSGLELVLAGCEEALYALQKRARVYIGR